MSDFGPPMRIWQESRESCVLVCWEKCFSDRKNDKEKFLSKY